MKERRIREPYILGMVKLRLVRCEAGRRIADGEGVVPCARSLKWRGRRVGGSHPRRNLRYATAALWC